MLTATVSDLISPSYFVLPAAVELGFCRDEGVDIEFVVPRLDGLDALREGEVDLLGGSAYRALIAFPNWQGGKLICALSQYSYWFLVVRADLEAKKGDLQAVKGLRLSASEGPHVMLERLLMAGGIDFERDNVSVIPIPARAGTERKLSRIGVEALEAGVADGFWGNAMRAEVAVRQGIGTVLLDVRRGDGPEAARYFTFPSLAARDRLLQEQPDALAAVVRAVVRAQQALAAEPGLATKVARKWFPPAETEIIGDLIARDSPFYQAEIPEDRIIRLNQFAQDAGLLDGPVPYDQVVATQFAPYWRPRGG